MAAQIGRGPATVPRLLDERDQPSFDKQYVRDWLTSSGWDRVSPPPELPADVVAATRERYVTAYEQLTGRTFG